MMRTWKTIGLCVAALAVIVPSAPAQEANARVNQVRAGIVVPRNQESFPAPFPHVFHNLNRDYLVRPSNLRFVNPHAVSFVTPEMVSKWGSRGILPVGSRVMSSMAGYWEVTLSGISPDQISDYDVLLLQMTPGFSLNPAEREKLRRFVDKGGVLWIEGDISGSATDIYNPAPIPVRFGSAGTVVDGIDIDHPLMNVPNSISLDDFLLNRAPVTVQAPNLGNYNGQAWLRADGQRLREVAVGPGGAVLSVATIGEGYVVASGAPISPTLNHLDESTASVQAGQRFLAPKRFTSTRFTSAAKLALNIVNLGSSLVSPGGGSRRMTSTGAELPAPLLRRFRTTDSPSPAVGTVPVTFGGIAVYNTGNSLVALDLDPGRDLDQDGNPDDGFEDDPQSGADIVWVANASGSKVSPVILPSPGVGIPDRVLLTLPNGVIQAFNLSVDGGLFENRQAAAQVDAPRSASITNPMPPTIHEGVGLVVATGDATSGRGIAWQFDVVSLKILSGPNEFVLQSASQMSAPQTSATVGYINILDNSGGMDKVAYIPTKRGGPRQSPAGMTSVWLATRGESPVAISQPATEVILSTRASTQGVPIVDTGNSSSPFGVKLSFMDLSGRPVDPTTAISGTVDVNWNNQNGIIRFQLRNGLRLVATPSEPANLAVRVDYTLNWGATRTTVADDQFVRGFLEFPDQISPKRDVIGHIGLAPSGTVMVVTSAPVADKTSVGGSVMAFREEGRGEFKMLYRWELFDEAKYVLNGRAGATLNYGPALIDQDGLLDLPFMGGRTLGEAFLDRRYTKMKFVTGPIIRGNTAYVAAAGEKVGVPGFQSVILALDANPKPAEMFAKNLSGNLLISQTDTARQESTPLQSFLVSNQFSYEIEPDATDGTGRLRISNFMTQTRGRITQSLAINQPIVIRPSGQPEIIFEPEATSDPSGTYVPGNAGGRWSPLRWYTSINGTRLGSEEGAGEGDVNTSIMSGSGNMLFFGGASVLPGLLNKGFDGFTDPPKSLLYALDINISPTDLISTTRTRPWMNASKTLPRPWMKVLSSLAVNEGNRRNPVVPSVYYRWPQYFGINNFNDLRIRLNQAVMNENYLNGVVASESSLLAWGRETQGATLISGLNAYTRADFFVIDEGRVSRIDSSGNSLWAVEATKDRSAEVLDAAITTPLQSPWRIYPVANGGFIIVDSGADRIVRTDSAGNEVRSVTGMVVDDKFIPDGVSDNPPLKLRLPRDVVTWTEVRRAAQNPFTNPQPSEYWRHYLIADSGNRRVIQLVDRYSYTNGKVGRPVTFVQNGATQQGLGVLFWHMPAQYSGKQYAYNSIGRIATPVSAGSKQVSYKFAFGFGNVEPGKRAAGVEGNTIQPDDYSDAVSGGGGILYIDPQKGTTALISRFEVGASPSGVFWDRVSRSFDVNYETNPDRPNRIQRIRGLTSVTLSQLSSGELSIMFTDNTGVYELVEKGGVWQTRWMLPSEAFVVMRRSLTNSRDLYPDNPISFRPTFARRLSGDEVIVCNGYLGRTQGWESNTGRPYNGEVMLVDGSFDTSTSPKNDEPGFNWNKQNLGFNVLSIRFNLPPITGSRGLTVPVFADRR